MSRDITLVGLLQSYLNRGDLLHDLRETVRQLRKASSADDDVAARSVKTRPNGGRRRITNRLTQSEIEELIAAFEAGKATRMELAKRYGIGRTSVAKLLREWRQRKAGQDKA